MFWKADVAAKIVEDSLDRDQVRTLTASKKRIGDSHRSGRTGRKSVKKPFALQWKDAETGLKFVITSRKKNVTDAELLNASLEFVKSVQDKMAEEDKERH